MIRPAFILAIIALLATAAPSTAEPPGFYPCYSYRIYRNLLNGEPARALADLQQCAESYKSKTSHLTPGDALKQSEWLDVLTLSRFQCAVVQINAINGNHKAAAALLSEIKKNSQSWWHTNQLFIGDGWRTLLEATEGFLIEAKADLPSAKQWYAAHPSRYTLGRLAVLQLSESLHEAAWESAQKALALDFGSASAHYVVGAISEIRGDHSQARKSFEAANRSIAGDSERLQKPRDRQWPLRFLEAGKIRTALESARRAP